MLRQYELVEKVRSYDPDADEGLINRAYVFSMKAHGDQQRASGDPYFSHPIEVAGILTDLKLDDQTIATAILHDTIEDTLATTEEIEKLFGKSVARLVDGVTKLSKIEAQSENERAAENLRKFLLALSDDIRVLLVKLADRLHNMRTLHHIPSEDKRRRIARETMDIYAPLAERIGMYEMMTEMQTLAFRELEPDAYASIARRLKQLTESGGDLVSRIGLGLQLYLADNGLTAEVLGRQKHPYSIWKKMAERHISFEQLSDVMAFRIIVADVADCYRALGLIHRRWPMVPGRFKDYISTPKRNGYRSLHTSVIHDSKMRIEIQIRSHDMSLTNNGVGPARLEAMQFFYNGKPMANPRDFLNLCCAWNSNFVFMSEPVTGVLRPGQQTKFIRLARTDANSAIWERLNAERWKVVVRSCYCSVFDDCWVADNRKKRPEPVKSCPANWTTFDERPFAGTSGASQAGF